MKWTEHDQLMRDRVMEKLSDDERLWWKGLLERMREDAEIEVKSAAKEAKEKANEWWQKNVTDWWRDIGGLGSPFEDPTVPTRTQAVVHYRARDDRNIVERGVDFIFGGW